MMSQGVSSRRTFQPVRRNSRLKGREGVFFRPTSRDEVKRVLHAAKRFERVYREKGKRTGPLGTVALEVLELLTNMISFKTGQLDPSIATIMRHCKRSRDAVVRALANLRQHGFLDWLRRYEPAENEGAGPQVKQATNAYRLALPSRAVALLGQVLARFLPADDEHRREQEAAEAKAMIERLPLFEQGSAVLGSSNPLGAALDRLGGALLRRKERESAEQTESHPHSYIKR